ncbi:hypothetical protein MUK42_14065 [Musa troglodytarum]|uniref:Uncharacterized protein n=1 Tax=Musa troglodytarum TaxID=320322 RepID=A0A9E7I3Y7_9LILI|nr:hypothetical protein MUK42_14065 [Musa troglodytarum]
MPMPCLPSPAVGAIQFPLVPDSGAAGDLHLHLHQDAVPCHPREEDRLFFQTYSCMVLMDEEFETRIGFVASSGRQLE